MHPFENILSDIDVDNIVNDELGMAGIATLRNPDDRVFPRTLGIMLLKSGYALTFRRYHAYYTVEGRVPLELAIDLFKDDFARRYIRVDSIVGNDDPIKHAMPTGGAIVQYCHDLGRPMSMSILDIIDLANQGKIVGPRYIWRYDIDTHEALKYFVDKIRDWKLA